MTDKLTSRVSLCITLTVNSTASNILQNSHKPTLLHAEVLPAPPPLPPLPTPHLPLSATPFPLRHSTPPPPPTPWNHLGRDPAAFPAGVSNPSLKPAAGRWTRKSLHTVRREPVKSTSCSRLEPSWRRAATAEPARRR